MIHLLPAIDLLGGRAVRLYKGLREQATDVGDPRELARRFADAGAARLHVVDLDGAFAGEPVHLALIAELARVLPVQLGGGLRTREDLRAALDAGADRLILGTAAVEDPALLDAVAPEALVVGVDVKEGRVAVRGWAETASLGPGDFVRALAARGVRRVLCTAVHRDGTLEGPDLDVLREVSAPGVAVIASGGIGSLADLRALKALPAVDEVVVGKALYAGAFTLAEGVAACS